MCSSASVTRRVQRQVVVEKVPKQEVCSRVSVTDVFESVKREVHEEELSREHQARVALGRGASRASSASCLRKRCLESVKRELP